MASAKSSVVKQTILTLSEAEANALYALLYTGVSRKGLETVGLSDLSSVLKSAGANQQFDHTWGLIAVLKEDM